MAFGSIHHYNNMLCFRSMGSCVVFHIYWVCAVRTSAHVRTPPWVRGGTDAALPLRDYSPPWPMHSCSSMTSARAARPMRNEDRCAGVWMEGTVCTPCTELAFVQVGRKNKNKEGLAGGLNCPFFSFFWSRSQGWRKVTGFDLEGSNGWVSHWIRLLLQHD
jgi:hypothetical protein